MGQKPRRSAAPTRSVKVAVDERVKLLAEFLNVLFTENYYFPESIVLVIMNSSRVVGDTLCRIDFKPNASLPTTAWFRAKAEDFLARSQHDCKVLGKKQHYAVIAWNTMRSDRPIARHLILCTPKKEDARGSQAA